MRQKIGIFSKICVMATAACMCFAFNSYAATKTKQTKSNTSTKPVVVNNKTSQFDEVFSDLGAKTADTTSADLAERVRQQRALLDGKGNSQSVAKASGVTGANACDATLRKCMAEKCGSDFTKCAKDSTAIWGDKMDSCRRKTQCTGHEYSLLAPEILADRDFNERMSYYNSVISCGNRYNSCIFAECGTMLEKCLSKSDGGRAVSKCASVAKDCKEQDSGMAARVMSVFGDLRTVATAQAEKDEKRLYELRDLMRNQCNRLGAVFDERTLDCVYTVNFFAGDNTSTPTSSKKLYAGDSFQCNANWFGIDVTTFKENAYRRTRAQTSASSAMMGAGVGVAAGLLSSGAIDRALDTQRAEKAAKEECQNSGYTWEKGACNKDKPYTGNKNNNDDDDETGEEVTDASGNNGQSGNENQQNLEQECTEKGRKYANGSCTTECLAEGYEYDSTSQTCNEHSNANELFLYCSGFEEESTCDTDTCEWNDSCVPKSASQSNVSMEETPSAHTAVDPNKKVNISLQITDKTQTVKLMAEIKCGTQSAKTPTIGKKITLRNIPSTETCTISAAPYCESKDFTAGELSQGSQKFLVCPDIDECISDGNTWTTKNECKAKSGASDGCDKVCKGLANKLSAKNPLQVLGAAQKSCENTCTPMMETACNNFVGKKYQSKKITSAKLTKEQVTNDDIQYKCEWSTDSDSNGTTNCVTTCTNLADAMSVEHPTQTLKQPSCKDACEMVIGPKCSALGLQTNATLTQLKKRITSTEIQYTCEMSADVPNDVDMCKDIAEVACKGQCQWDGQSCVQKKKITQ